MGYSTDFTGRIELSRPLTVSEARTLTEFSEERHDDATGPGIWCDFAPTSDGHAIAWNGNEKTYDAVEWVQYLVDNFLRPWGITANGALSACGQRPGDLWQVKVVDNEVTRLAAHVMYGS